MAALHLHQALFSISSTVPQPETFSARSSLADDRRLSAISAVSPSNSDHSHPTEPLLNSPGPETSPYHDLLARQPRHPASPGASAGAALRLVGDPVPFTEHRSRQERQIRRRLRRLRWTKGSLLAVIGGWALYNTIRYFLAFSNNPHRDPQMVLLSLGASTALSLTLILASLLIAAFAPRLRWTHIPNAPRAVVQVVLFYLSSALLLGPAVVNLAFVFVWRHTSDLVLNPTRRCHWDIDVFWSGFGWQCDASSWPEWLAGAVVRTILTLAVLVVYHLTTYQYDLTRQPSRRRRRGSRPRSSSSLPSILRMSTSTGSHLPMMSASSPMCPVLLAQIGRQLSMSTSEGHTTIESYSSSGEHRPLRRSRPRINAQSVLANRSNEGFVISTLSPTLSPPASEKACSPERARHEDAYRNSSVEDLPSSVEAGRFRRPVQQIPSSHTFPSSDDTPQGCDAEGDPRDGLSDNELHGFVDRFRSLVEEFTRETEEGIALAQNDSPGYDSFPPSYDATNLRPSHYPSFYSADDDDDDYVPVLGRTIHRMPTIESLGSREVMSLATSSVHRASPGPHHMSRPSTRSNNFSVSDTGADTPSVRSRANSLDAVLALATPATMDAQEEVGQGGLLSSPAFYVSISSSHASTTSSPQQSCFSEGE